MHRGQAEACMGHRRCKNGVNSGAIQLTAEMVGNPASNVSINETGPWQGQV